ncbi:hypothetical protein GCM10009668_11940 [Nocardioides dubius]|uniref:DUF222 domain-containing protein n=1 Tax=Nocardioides dubius TaxID=317019 RepID=A0ABP4EAM5_9ACTN
MQHLVARGELRSLARGVVDETSVERLQAVRRGSHARAWAESTAWAAVALLSGGEAGWLGESQRSRIRGRLRRLGADELVERTRGRAGVSRYVAHRSATERLRGDVVDTSSVATRLGLAATNAIDGYLATKALKEVVARHGLMRDCTGNVTLRATSVDLEVVRDLISASDVLAALDLAESLDVRERRAGTNARWRRSVVDRRTIDVATPAGGWGAPWPNVAEIEAVLSHDKWTTARGVCRRRRCAHQPDSRDPERRPRGTVPLLAVIDDPYTEGENFVGSDRPRLPALVRARPDTATQRQTVPTNSRFDCWTALRVLNPGSDVGASLAADRRTYRARSGR